MHGVSQNNTSLIELGVSGPHRNNAKEALDALFDASCELGPIFVVPANQLAPTSRNIASVLGESAYWFKRVDGLQPQQNAPGGNANTSHTPAGTAVAGNRTLGNAPVATDAATDPATAVASRTMDISVHGAGTPDDPMELSDDEVTGQNDAQTSGQQGAESDAVTGGEGGTVKQEPET